MKQLRGRRIGGRHPGMLPHQAGRRAARGVHVEHAEDQVLGLLGHAAPVARVHVHLAVADAREDHVGAVGGAVGKRGRAVGGRKPG